MASYGDVTPSRDDVGRRTDASRLTFPLQLVLTIVATTISVTGAFWVMSAQLRIDIAVIRQVQADQAKIDEYKTKLEEANRQLIQQGIDGLKSELNAVRGLAQLANIEIGNVRREINDRSQGAKR